MELKQHVYVLAVSTEDSTTLLTPLSGTFLKFQAPVYDILPPLLGVSELDLTGSQNWLRCPEEHRRDQRQLSS